MFRTDGTFRAAVEEAVRRIEARTAAEVVVVAAQRSGSYRDVALVVGAVAAWVVLVALIASPVLFSALWVPIEIAVTLAAVAWVAHRSPAVLARLVPGRRKKRQCLEAARVAFLEEAVDRTRSRTGVLVYLSMLERRVVVIPDAGVLGRVAGGAVHAVRWGEGRDPEDVTSLGAFLAGLEALGAALGDGLPPEGENSNERPDAPRIRA